MLLSGHRLRRPPSSGAFTLLELLAVIGVVAVLAGIAIGVGRHVLASARVSRARAELFTLAAALESYRTAYGDYPRTNVPARLLQSLLGRRGPDGTALTGPARIELARFSVSPGSDGQVSDTAELLDPWDHPYRYAYKSTTPWNAGFVLYSAGPDGAASEALLPGGVPDVAAAANLDNLYSDR